MGTGLRGTFHKSPIFINNLSKTFECCCANRQIKMIKSIRIQKTRSHLRFMSFVYFNFEWHNKILRLRSQNLPHTTGLNDCQGELKNPYSRGWKSEYIL